MNALRTAAAGAVGLARVRPATVVIGARAMAGGGGGSPLKDRESALEVSARPADRL